MLSQVHLALAGPRSVCCILLLGWWLADFASWVRCPLHQRDAQERSHRVLVMGTIYTNVCTFYLCMGDHPDVRASDVLFILKELKPYVDMVAVSAFLQLDNIDN